MLKYMGPACIFVAMSPDEADGVSDTSGRVCVRFVVLFSDATTSGNSESLLWGLASTTCACRRVPEVENDGRTICKREATTTEMTRTNRGEIRFLVVSFSLSNREDMATTAAALESLFR